MEEVWKDIQGFEGSYQISNLGRVKSLARRIGKVGKRERIRKLSTNKLGYKEVGINNSGKQIRFYVHRLVAEAFILNPENKPFVCHIDDDPSNNCADNLFWGTQKDNMQDKIKKGRYTPCKGSTNGNSKLNEEIVLTIKRELLNYKRGDAAKLGRQFNITKEAVYGIRDGKIWKHVTTSQ